LKKIKRQIWQRNLQQFSQQSAIQPQLLNGGLRFRSPQQFALQVFTALAILVKQLYIHKLL
jgi:hypothetical protein